MLFSDEFCTNRRRGHTSVYCFFSHQCVCVCVRVCILPKTTNNFLIRPKQLTHNRNKFEQVCGDDSDWLNYWCTLIGIAVSHFSSNKNVCVCVSSGNNICCITKMGQFEEMQHFHSTKILVIFANGWNYLHIQFQSHTLLLSSSSSLLSEAEYAPFDAYAIAPSLQQQQQQKRRNENLTTSLNCYQKT